MRGHQKMRPKGYISEGYRARREAATPFGGYPQEERGGPGNLRQTSGQASYPETSQQTQRSIKNEGVVLIFGGGSFAKGGKKNRASSGAREKKDAVLRM